MTNPVTILSSTYSGPKPPKIAHNLADPFDRQVMGKAAGEKVCQDFSLAYNPSGPSVWLYIPKHVAPHVDGNGSAFVYLYRGKGTLWVLDAGTLHPFWLLPGYVATFDDTLSHFWLSATPCTVLAGNYRA